MTIHSIFHFTSFYHCIFNNLTIKSDRWKIRFIIIETLIEMKIENNIETQTVEKSKKKQQEYLN